MPAVDEAEFWAIIERGATAADLRRELGTLSDSELLEFEHLHDEWEDWMSPTTHVIYTRTGTYGFAGPRESTAPAEFAGRTRDHVAGPGAAESE